MPRGFAPSHPLTTADAKHSVYSAYATNLNKRCPGRLSTSGSVSGTCRVTVDSILQHELHLIWKSCWTPLYVNKYK